MNAKQDPDDDEQELARIKRLKRRQALALANAIRRAGARERNETDDDELWELVILIKRMGD